MANWLETLADSDLEFQKNGLTIFLDFKAACASTIDTFNERFAPSSAELVDCASINQNCFRIRISTPKERQLEIYFKPSQKMVSIRWTPSPSPKEQGRDLLKADIVMLDGKLAFAKHADPPSRVKDQGVSPEDLSHFVLERFLFPDGRPMPTK